MLNRASKKLMEKWIGPYEVTRVTPNAVKLKLPKTLRIQVHWKGYEEHERTWEPASNVKNAPLVVEHFYKENPSGPQKLCMAQLDFDSLCKPVPENLTICEPQFCSLESCS